MAGPQGGGRDCVDSEDQSGPGDRREETSLQEAVSCNQAQQQLPLPLHLHDDGGCSQSHDLLISRFLKLY